MPIFSLIFFLPYLVKIKFKMWVCYSVKCTRATGVLALIENTIRKGEVTVTRDLIGWSTDEIEEGEDPTVEVRSREGFEVFGEGREVGVDPAVHLVRGDDMIRGHRRQPRSSFRLPFARPRIGKRGIFLTRRRAYGHQRLLYSPSARARERERGLGREMEGFSTGLRFSDGDACWME